LSKLFIVPTPVGNLEDITTRGINTLKESAFILAEDTRKSGILLNHFGINTKMYSYHAHNEHKIIDKIIDEIKNNDFVSLISDAGTPGISDPGYLLIRKCIEENIEVITLPGPTAFVPALVNSGLPCDRFYFEGFLPQKKGRQTRLKKIAEMDQTIILYESPYRILKTLKQLAEHIPLDRKVSISREISKKFEETVRGTLEELIVAFEDKKNKGEFVMIIEGNNSNKK